jgi:hypothetical protein
MALLDHLVLDVLEPVTTLTDSVEHLAAGVAYTLPHLVPQVTCLVEVLGDAVDDILPDEGLNQLLAGL